MRGGMNATDDSAPFDPAAITRPVPALLTYYTWVSALALIGFAPVIGAAAQRSLHTPLSASSSPGVAEAGGFVLRKGEKIIQGYEWFLPGLEPQTWAAIATMIAGAVAVTIVERLGGAKPAKET